MHVNLVGHGPSSLLWDVLPGEHENEGLTVKVHFGWKDEGSSDRRNLKQAASFVKLKRHVHFSWLRVTDHNWYIDATELKRKFPNLDLIDWLEGGWWVKPEILAEEKVVPFNVTPHGPRQERRYICLYFVFTITPGSRRKCVPPDCREANSKNDQGGRMHYVQLLVQPNGGIEQNSYEGDNQIPDSGICVYFDFQALLNDSAAPIQASAKAEEAGIEWLKPGREKWSIDLDLLKESLLDKHPSLAQEYAWMRGTAYVTPKVEQDHRTSSNSTLTTTVCLYLFKEHFILDQKTKIFLSHKGVDKPLVRQFYDVLKELGFDPWLDEEDLSAGSELHRSIRQGFKDSCAAVFFITPQFVDDKYIKAEVNHAVTEKTEKGDRFSIISVVFKGKKGEKAKVPEILDQYVWREPESDLQALYEIIRALPVKLGPPTWRSGR